MSIYPRDPSLAGAVQTDGSVTVGQGFPKLFRVVPDATATVLAATGITGTASATVTASITQPDVPRNVVVVSSNNDDDGTAFPVTVNGADFNGDSVSEEIDLDGTTDAAGSLAFGSITSIVLPGGGSGSVTVSTGTVFGLPDKMDTAELLSVTQNGTADATPTVATSSGTLAANTVTPDAAPDGTKVLDVKYITFSSIQTLT